MSKKRGGRRQGAGRKPLDLSERKQPKTIWLSPAEQQTCLKFGETIQDGIRHLISEAMKDDDDESGEAGQICGGSSFTVGAFGSEDR